MSDNLSWTFNKLQNFFPSLEDIETIKAKTIDVVDVVKGKSISRKGIVKHTVTFIKFDKYTLNDITTHYLILGTYSGFQVYLINYNYNNNNNINTKKKINKKVLLMKNNIEIIKVAPNNKESI